MFSDYMHLIKFFVGLKRVSVSPGPLCFFNLGAELSGFVPSKISTSRTFDSHRIQTAIRFLNPYLQSVIQLEEFRNESNRLKTFKNTGTILMSLYFPNSFLSLFYKEPLLLLVVYSKERWRSLYMDRVHT